MWSVDYSVLRNIILTNPVGHTRRVENVCRDSCLPFTLKRKKKKRNEPFVCLWWQQVFWKLPPWVQKCAESGKNATPSPQKNPFLRAVHFLSYSTSLHHILHTISLLISIFLHISLSLSLVLCVGLICSAAFSTLRLKTRKRKQGRKETLCKTHSLEKTLEISIFYFYYDGNSLNAHYSQKLQCVDWRIQHVLYK